MDGNYKPYDYQSASDRIKDILNQPTGVFQETSDLPNRDKLTFTNGFYGSCSAIFVDIRDSSGLTTIYKRPNLAKIYRAFISEMVAVLNSAQSVREVSIVGDCVWAVYNTPKKPDIDEVFDVAVTANSVKALLNAHYEKKAIKPLRLGIGVDWGRALMIKAGFSGSGINDVVYMGDVVNRAAHIAHEADRNYNPSILVGSDFHLNLNDTNKTHLRSQAISGLSNVYGGSLVFPSIVSFAESL